MFLVQFSGGIKSFVYFCDMSIPVPVFFVGGSGGSCAGCGGVCCFLYCGDDDGFVCVYVLRWADVLQLLPDGLRELDPVGFFGVPFGSDFGRRWNLV